MTENTPYIKKVFECISLTKEHIYRIILLILDVYLGRHLLIDDLSGETLLKD